MERASELDGGRFILCNDETCESVNPVSLGKVAAEACPRIREYTADPLLPPWKFAAAKALSHVPFVLGPSVMTEYERRVFEARTTLSNARGRRMNWGSPSGRMRPRSADTVRGCVQVGIAHRRAAVRTVFNSAPSVTPRRMGQPRGRARACRPGDEEFRREYRDEPLAVRVFMGFVISRRLDFSM